MATFDDIYEVRVRMHMITEEMRKHGIFMTTLNGFIVEFHPLRGVVLMFKDTIPEADQPIKLQKVLLDWQYIIDITVLPRRAQLYKKKEHYLD
jgi:hypothetical protein